MSKWRPIETAPRDGTTILVWNGCVVLACWERCKEWPEDDIGFNDWSAGPKELNGEFIGFDRVYAVTHWMPLPEPPE